MVVYSTSRRGFLGLLAGLGAPLIGSRAAETALDTIFERNDHSSAGSEVTLFCYDCFGRVLSETSASPPSGDADETRV